MIKCKYLYDIKRKEKSWFCPVGKRPLRACRQNGIAVALPQNTGAALSTGRSGMQAGGPGI